MLISIDEICQKKLDKKTVIFRTDTVYGIGALYHDKVGVQKIYQIKGREKNKPLVILCASLKEALTFTTDETHLRPLAQKYWPGALTLVVSKSDAVPAFVNAGFDTIGLRIPHDPIALRLLKHFGPMAVTSLNLSHQPEVKTFKEALRFNHLSDYIVEADDAKGRASTVYDVSNKRVLRQGSVIVK